MGFQLTNLGNSHCVFKATPEGDDVEEFVLCVQKALKGLLLEITLDLTDSPKSLGAVLPHLMKLQKVLGQHQRAVTVVGLNGGSHSEFVLSLKALGINVYDGDSRAAAHSVIHQSLDNAGVSARHTAGAQPGGVLPPAAEIEVHFKQLKLAFAEGLTRKAELTREKRSYEQRLHFLKNQSHGEGTHDPVQVQRLAELEHKVIEVREAREDLSERFTAEQKRLTGVMKTGQDSVGARQEAFRKEKEALDKQLAELNRAHEKIKAEFKKKSDARREKLTHG